MRTKVTYQEWFNCDASSSVKEVREYVRKYELLDELLKINPEILNAVHKDLSRKLSMSKQGRSSDYTSEEMFRSIVVMFIEQYSYRDAVKNIDTNVVLRNFVRLGIKPMMDPGFLSKVYGSLSESTWEEINRVLGGYAKEEALIGGEKLRMDSTVVESNIHYPTDSSLLWDSYRTLSRLMREISVEMKAVGLFHRFHDKKIKKLAYFISRNGGSSSKRKQQQVKKTYRKLINRVQWICGVAHNAASLLSGELLPEVVELKHYLPLVEKVIDQAERRVFQGEMLPAEEKLYSIFEEHTELIKRGKAGTPVEFGHKVLLAQNEDKFITHYQVLPERKDDTELLQGALDAHKTLFEKAPSVLAADRGFYKDREQLKQLAEEIETVSIAKKGNRTAEEKERESTEEFKEGQRFRAGSEGSISVLKRAFKLKKCLFKGYKNFAASVGCAVFCHNLVLLTQL